eukprot:80385-Alexandrium_andersonii.AAC.1
MCIRDRCRPGRAWRSHGGTERYAAQDPAGKYHNSDGAGGRPGALWPYRAHPRGPGGCACPRHAPRS